MPTLVGPSGGMTLALAAQNALEQAKGLCNAAQSAKGHQESCAVLANNVRRMMPLLEELAQRGPPVLKEGVLSGIAQTLQESLSKARNLVDDCCSYSSIRLLLQGSQFSDRFNAATKLIDGCYDQLQEILTSSACASQVQKILAKDGPISEADQQFVAGVMRDLKAQGAAGSEFAATLSAKLAEHLGNGRSQHSAMQEELHALRREKEELLREKSQSGEKYMADVMKVLEESGLASGDSHVEFAKLLEERVGKGKHRRDSHSRRESFSGPPEPPDAFICPISLQIMVDPVIVAATGISYDRASIHLWFAVGNHTCPKTNMHLDNRMLTPNYALKKLIEDWARENSVELPDAPTLPNIVESVEGRTSAEAVEQAVRMLTSGTLEDQIRAAESIKVLARGDELRATIARTGVFPLLVHMLRLDAQGANEQAAGALRNLACNSADNKVAIARVGAIPPLVQMLSTGSLNAQQEAAGALRNLACNDENKTHIAAEGAIAPIVAVLTAGCPGAKEEAAGALKNLACNNAENKVAIVSSGAIDPLVEMLRSGGPSAQREAAGALSNLAGNNAANKMAIAHAGAIGPLVEVVRSGNASAQEEAAGVLRNLAGNNSDSRVAEGIAKAGAIPPLVDLLRSSSPGAQKEAAGALRNLACNNADNKVAIIAAGAVPPLVALLQSDEPSSQQEAAAALGNLACNEDNKEAITRAGAIDPLISVLRSGNSCAQEHAVFALRRLRVSSLHLPRRNGGGGGGN